PLAKRHELHLPGISRRIVFRELLLQSADQGVQPFLRRRDRQAGFESGDGRRKIAPAAWRMIWHWRAVKARCGPGFDISLFGNSPRCVKGRWHDPDDAV